MFYTPIYFYYRSFTLTLISSLIESTLFFVDLSLLKPECLIDFLIVPLFLQSPSDLGSVTY